MLYFAYGSNMDVAAMAQRCPNSRALGLARLMRHRFYLMGRSGYASVRRDTRGTVHGVLFDLALCDLPALDRYEDVAHGLYTKAQQLVVLGGGASRRALLYYGADVSERGDPPTGYMEGVVAAARAAALPTAYVTTLEAHLPQRGRP